MLFHIESLRQKTPGNVNRPSLSGVKRRFQHRLDFTWYSNKYNYLLLSSFLKTENLHISEIKFDDMRIKNGKCSLNFKIHLALHILLRFKYALFFKDYFTLPHPLLQLPFLCDFQSILKSLYPIIIDAGFTFNIMCLLPDLLQISKCYLRVRWSKKCDTIKGNESHVGNIPFWFFNRN